MTQPQKTDSNLSDHAERVLAYLQQVRDAQLDLQKLQSLIDETSARSVSLPSPSAISDMGVQHAFSGNAPFEFSVADKDDLEREFRNLENSLKPLRDQALQIIRQQTNTLQRIAFTWYFFYGYPWNVVARRIDRTERHVYRLRNEALEKIILPEDAIWLE